MFCSPRLSDRWTCETLDDALVGGHTKQEESTQALWNRRRTHFYAILGFSPFVIRMMKISFMLLLCGAAAFSCTTKKGDIPEVPSQEVNDYPEITLRLTDGNEIPARKLSGNNIFVLFQPDCDHCQEEAIFIEQRLEDFKDYTLYFISSADAQSITAFAENFNLHKKENVRFAWTSTEGVLNHYGPIQTPSVYIYSNGRLKQSFNGQTDVQNIIDAL